MSYQQALKTLNFSGNLSREEYKGIAADILNSRSSSFRIKRAARVLLKGE